jgi:hypothetical protein
MKTKIIFIVYFISIFHYNKIFAQATEEEISKEFYKADGNINLIINNLPAGWVFTADKGDFIIFRKDSVLILSENRINAPLENKEVKLNHIKEFGVKTQAKVIIHYENKWDFLRIQEAQIKNASIMDEIQKLPEKMKITSLLDSKLSRKGKPVYTAKNEKDQLCISNYYKEEERLEKKIVKLPDFNSQLYSLFIVSEDGKEDNMHYVYPTGASIELYTILSLFREACGK